MPYTTKLLLTKNIDRVWATRLTGTSGTFLKPVRRCMSVITGDESYPRLSDQLLSSQPRVGLWRHLGHGIEIHPPMSHDSSGNSTKARSLESLDWHNGSPSVTRAYTRNTPEAVFTTFHRLGFSTVSWNAHFCAVLPSRIIPFCLVRTTM